MIDLGLLLLFSFFGVIVGIATGLLPGLHVNNIALILLSLSAAIVAICEPLLAFGLSESFLLLLIAAFITGCATSHTFHDCIPTTFLGAPEEDTALSVLPAHKLLLEGKGYEAVAYSALGSYGAIVVCFLLLFPLRFVIGQPLMIYENLQSIMAWVLIAISILMIATEKSKIEDHGLTGKPAYAAGMGFALFVFFLSGIFGLVILDFPVDSPIGLSAPVLFPALAGLFGMPTLLTSLWTKPVIPEQHIAPLSLEKKQRKSSILSVITGSLAGVLVSIIPGITSATGTIMAMNARGESDNRQTIVTLSAVNTASAFTVMAVLFIILRPRSGAAIAVQELIAVEEWTAVLMPSNLAYLLITLVFAGALSFILTLVIGKWFARKFIKLPYSALVGGTILSVCVLVFIFTGVLGLCILAVATLIGLLPVQWGVRRSHCMGILLIPIILHFL